ncbi:hypothetical protein QJS10_CPA10g01333 [Acorus calamus]|uniref:Uncharacterized protein n=1 Tax=Acorus calamus TaxID=4465 RepID=A0AAV9DWP1_ACOCL|nr:hypothetical protein QJS10_CPA10g01333 [Acorus calamus]
MSELFGLTLALKAMAHQRHDDDEEKEDEEEEEVNHRGQSFWTLRRWLTLPKRRKRRKVKTVKKVAGMEK